MKIEIVEDIKKKLEMDNRYIKEVIKGEVKIDKKRAEKTLVLTPESFSKIFSLQ